MKSNARIPVRKKRLTARGLILLVFMGVFLLVSVSVVFAYKIEAFQVKIVEVTGMERVNAESIYSNSHIIIGENLLTLPVGDMREEIVQGQPLVKDVKIKRKLPSRVSIEIFERQPLACLTNGQRYYLIDEERFVIEIPAGITDPDLFVVRSDTIQHAEVGEKIEFPQHAVFGSMVASLENKLAGLYTMVRFDQKGIKLFLKDDTYVLLGDGSDIEKKIDLIPVIITNLKKAEEDYEGLNLEYIEVPSFITRKK